MGSARFCDSARLSRRGKVGGGIPKLTVYNSENHVLVPKNCSDCLLWSTRTTSQSLSHAIREQELARSI